WNTKNIDTYFTNLVSSNSMRRVRDSIHDYIDLDSLESSLVDTKPYQRLRWIKQLGSANLVYPGANHTRLEHSIGVSHLAKQMALQSDVPGDELHLVSIAGLLHDLGHSPYSHLADELPFGKDHVDITQDIIKESQISDIFNDEGIDSREICNLIKGEHRYGSLISGDIDADRLDYLIRDSHYTGVKTGVDTGRLVTKMSITNGELVIGESGLPVVETFLTSRSVMFPTVYFHPFSRGAELMLARATKAAILSGYFSYESFVSYTDHKFLSELDSAGGISKSLVNDFENRKITKRVVSITKDETENKGITKSDVEDLEISISSKLGIDSSKVFMDLPPLKVVPDMKVKILKEDGSLDYASNMSTITKSLYEAQFDHWRCRIYAPASLSEEASKITKRELGL
ncbi:MAG: HD domain-containing protein, partial [Candidatus Thermoplasmatota archaeon]|nr:HD domain-containing protein [Candidatus Thermoplasmatota archaeon]